jgi:hypothetical protein
MVLLPHNDCGYPCRFDASFFSFLAAFGVFIAASSASFLRPDSCSFHPPLMLADPPLTEGEATLRKYRTSPNDPFFQLVTSDTTLVLSLRRGATAT